MNDLRVAARTHTESLGMFFPEDLRLRERVEEYIASHGCSLGFNFQSAPLATPARSLSALAFNDHTSVRFMRLAHGTALFFFVPIRPPTTAFKTGTSGRRQAHINEAPFDVVCKWKRLLFTASIYMRDLLLPHLCVFVLFVEFAPSLWCARALEFVCPPLIMCLRVYPLAAVCSTSLFVV